MKKEIVIPCEGSKTKKCIIPVKEFKEIKRILKFMRQADRLGVGEETIGFAFQLDVLYKGERETAEFGMMHVEVSEYKDQGVEFVQVAGCGEVTAVIEVKKLARLVS